MKVTKTHFMNLCENFYRSNVFTYLLFLNILLILYFSFSPFQFINSWQQVINELNSGLTLYIQTPILTTIFQRLVLFLPLGYLLHQYLVRKNINNTFFKSIILLFLFTLSIEVFQSIISERHSLLSDYVIAFSMSVLGAAFSRYGENDYIYFRRLTFTSLSMICVTILWIMGISHYGAQLNNWDCNNHFYIANESTNKRLWQGRISGLAVYPSKLHKADISNLANKSFNMYEDMKIREKLGAIAFYDFSQLQNGSFKQLINSGPKLNLVGSIDSSMLNIVKDNGLNINQPTLIRSHQPATVLCERIMQSHAVSIEFEAESFDVNQSGPARIISISNGHTLRNITIGEEKGELDLRIRTVRSGPNGSLITMRTDDQLMTTGAHHFVISFSEGTAEIYVDGEIHNELQYFDYLLANNSLMTPIILLIGILSLAMAIANTLLYSHKILIQRVLYSYLACALLPLLFTFGLAYIFNHSINYKLIILFVVIPFIAEYLILNLKDYKIIVWAKTKCSPAL